MKNIYDNQEFFEEYAKMGRSQKGLEAAGEWHQLKMFFPELDGKTVLDLGCGYGWHCQYAIEKGADKVIGIDLSEKMIAEAKARNGDHRIEYQVCGLDEYDYPEKTFDCVISNLVLHYVENLKDIYQNVYQTLKDDGIFIFNIEHPVFTGSVNQQWVCDHDGKPLYWPIDQYFMTGERTTQFLGKTVTKQHHTLTQILMELLEAGLQIEAIEEAKPPLDMMDLPGMKDELRRPMMLLVKAVKKI